MGKKITTTSENWIFRWFSPHTRRKYFKFPSKFNNELNFVFAVEIPQVLN